MVRSRHEQVVRITSAAESPGVDIAHRQRRYLISMAIRTLCARGGHAEYFVGGGIVADSQPEREVEETRWKAAQLLRAARVGR